jgi:large subunit ribosomal protein L13
MRTFSPRPRDIERRWYVMDADGVVLGRFASEVAKVLRGKHKPIFAPHMDTGDNVIVINARRIRLTGGKESEKLYHRHSGYPGGIRSIEYTRLLAERPAVAVEKAIKGMLPKNRLGRQMFNKLAVYEGSEHPHQAQKPVPLGVGEIPKWEGLPVPKPKAEKPRQASATRAVVEEQRPAGRSPAKRAAPRGRAASKPPSARRAAPERSRKASTAKVTAAPAKRRTRAASSEGAEKPEKKTGRTSRVTRRSRTKKES